MKCFAMHVDDHTDTRDNEGTPSRGRAGVTTSTERLQTPARLRYYCMELSQHVTEERLGNSLKTLLRNDNVILLKRY